MNILHIINDFNFTLVHKKLTMEIDKNGHGQIIFIPLKNPINIGRNHYDFEVLDSKIIYSKQLAFSHKFCFRNRISFLFKDLKTKVNFEDVDLVHASTLFSDGALALRIYKEFQIPYMLAIRNTDINTYMVLRKDLLFMGFNILKNAKRIIFISEANLSSFKSTILGHFSRLHLSNSSCVVFNGIDQSWLNNIRLYDNNSSHERKYKTLLYIGRFDTNKNVLRLIESFKIINKSDNFRLKLVGGGGNLHEKVLHKIEDCPSISYLGNVSDTVELLSIVRSCDAFVMCSIHETFGLVYIESLSQGIPVLYSRGQGIDGSFKNLVIGKGVNPYKVSDISKGLLAILQSDFNDINKIDFTEFYWDSIGKKYIHLYKQILSC